MPEYIGFVIVLFLLSMICERVADFLKHYLSEANDGFGYAIGKFLKIGNLLFKDEKNSLQEEKRYYRILKINIICGFVVAWILHADIFSIIENKNEPFKALGWGHIKWFFQKGADGNLQWNLLYSWLIFITGCFATGFFISFGSKFWHDLLDILFQIKNYRRLMADPATYTNIDNIKTFDKNVTTYESDVIQAAYAKAKNNLLAKPTVSGTALKYDSQGGYIEVLLKSNDNSIQNTYEYQMQDGQFKNVRLIKITDQEKAVLHSINLSDKIHNQISAEDVFGTVGCLVKKKGMNDVYVLTCYHNVASPDSKFKFSTESSKDAVLFDNSNKIAAVVFDAIRDAEMDVALVKLTSKQVNNITNQIAGLGSITAVREINNIQKPIKVFLHGAKSNQTGMLTAINSDAKFDYSDGEHKLYNLLMLQNGDTGISQKGDSGAIVVDANHQAIGMIVGGKSNLSYAIPMATIFHNLDLELFTS